MRRKRVDRLEGVPVELVRFDEAVWGSFNEWKAARSVWAESNSWPGGLLAKIVEEREVRLGLRGLAAPDRRSR